YEVAGALRDEIAAARRNSWLLVAGITLATGILLVGIVGAGSRTIQRQQLQLRAQIAEQQRLARANRELRLKVQRASAGAAETNERYLGRIGADLHDGPVQLLSLAALRLDAIETETDAAKRSAEIADLRQALQAAMRDIRGISRGLALPELGGKSLREVIRRAVDVHISLTRTEVALDLPATAPQLPHSQLIAVYRFVQEGLSNATRHAGGKGMRVEAEVLEDGRIRVSVCDAGPGLPETLDDSAGLGLRGLTERIESLGGDFSVENLAGGGVRIALTLDPDQESEDARR
ncbi:MAG: sensor histidine kinase, partial [Alphaproteobacteria bacterium]